MRPGRRARARGDAAAAIALRVDFLARHALMTIAMVDRAIRRGVLELQAERLAPGRLPDRISTLLTLTGP